MRKTKTVSILNAYKAGAISREVAMHDLLALGYSLHSIQQILGR